MRAVFVLLHRWFGLGVAVFLFISGATGAIISWDHELDAALNPTLFHANSADSGSVAGTPKPGLELANIVEAQEPKLRVTYVMNESEPGHTSSMMVEPRLDPATGKPYELGYNQVAVDPVTAEIQGKRMWGAISLSRENLLPFLYKLHYTMHLPEVGGIELGIWLMGIIGIVWALDCFIALWLSFPNLKSWRKSFAFRWKDGGHKLNFDLHRSGGVWVWGLLLVLAVTSVSMNLNNQVMTPVIKMFSTVTPTAFDTRTPVAPDKVAEPRMSRERIMQLAAEDGRRRGFEAPAGACSIPRRSGCTASVSSKPATTMATSVSATPGCTSTRPPARRPARGFRAQAAPATCSSRRNSPCIRDASSVCRAASSFPSWARWWRCCR